MVMVMESRYEDKISMISNSIQFFTDYLTDNCLIEWFSAFRKIFSKGIIDHCLVAISGLIRSHTKLLQDFRIKVNRYSGFSFQWKNLTSFGIFQIIFLSHIVSFPLASLFWPKLIGSQVMRMMKSYTYTYTYTICICQQSCLALAVITYPMARYPRRRFSHIRASCGWSCST